MGPAVWRPGGKVNTDYPEGDQKEFFPRGALAFFGVMICSYGLIWLGIFLLLIHRQSGL